MSSGNRHGISHHVCPTVRDELSPSRQDFNHRVIIRFEDESRASFEFAFAERVGEELHVYTEHCGYHAFHLAYLKGYTIKAYGKKVHPKRIR